MFFNDNPGRYVAAGRLGVLGASAAAGARGLYDIGRAYLRARKRLKANYGKSPARRAVNRDPTLGLRPQHQTMSRMTGRFSKFNRPYSERYLKRRPYRRYRPRKVTRRKRYKRRY